MKPARSLNVLISTKEPPKMWEALIGGSALTRFELSKRNLMVPT